jgi:hypothetical protein
MLSLLLGLAGALVRLGYAFPAATPEFVAFHGPLMVCGFLGTLISLERAVGIGRRWAISAPLTTGVGALSLGVVSGPAGLLGILVGSVVLLATLVVGYGIQPGWSAATLVAGAVSWMVGNALWLAGLGIPRAVPFWMTFLVLTIAGERLELSRVLQPPPLARIGFGLAIALILAGAVGSTVQSDPALRLLGAGLVALTAWLAIHDIARRSVGKPGLTRFIAVCLLSSYVWLAVSGVLILVCGVPVAGPRYDAILHALFLGFVMAMIFGHAPIIFPALLARPMRFLPAFYVHLGLLHATLSMRVAGDLVGAPAVVRWGGLLNVVTLLVFIANTVVAVATAAGVRAHEALRSGS